jgi:hypothetical protein
VTSNKEVMASIMLLAKQAVSEFCKCRDKYDHMVHQSICVTAHKYSVSTKKNSHLRVLSDL